MSRPCGNPKREFTRAHAHTLTLGFWGVNVVPLGPDPNPRLGLGPPGQSLPQVVTWVFPREFKKKEKKINKRMFLVQVSNSGLLHLNPNVLQAGTCARP